MKYSEEKESSERDILLNIQKAHQNKIAAIVIEQYISYAESVKMYCIDNI